MQLPREVIVGVNILDRVGEICTKLGFHGTALVVSGPVTYPLAGVGVAKSAAKAGLRVDHIIVKESTEAVLNQIIETIKKTRPSIVLAVGGGKDIDLGKLASAKASVPFMSIPTAASHDGIASPYASIKGGPKPYSIRAQAPIAIIGDIGVIADSPYDLLAAGCGDIVAKFSSRPCSGAEHLFSHALDIVAGETSLHGGRTGVGAIMCAYLHGSNWESIKEFLQEIGAPSTAKELRVSPEQVVKALTMAHSLRPERYTILGETGVTEGAAEKVARATGVIG
ncbi:iron-containing alcohol dehydrogenase [Candidatus Bathyarchaeota archaeon]|nr:MAG: iron-containing alcohol dehydrogenase [Candidatus Bathyarchaeota archaeon]